MADIIRLGVQGDTKQAETSIAKLIDTINDLKATIQGLNSTNGLGGIQKSAENSAKSYMDSVRKMADASKKAQQAMMKEQYQAAFKAVDRGLKYQAEQAKVAKESSQATVSSNRESTRSFADFKSALKGIDFPLKNFAKSLMRIAKLRFLRGIIRSITKAFKEGISNIYQYSAAMNNMDASHMKGSMDSLASSLLYMKNAVASAVAPLIAQLIPVIAQVANWFVTAASAVAQFFAALGGQTTYTRAKKEAVEWGKVESGASGAAAAAQEYKNTILGFDEIHALNDVPSKGGGGGGGGGATPDYSNMFEEAEVSQKIKDLVKWLKDNWNDILDIVKAIGVSLLAWKIASGVLNFFDGLGVGGKYAQGLAQLAAGIVITIAGVKLAYKGGYSIGYEGPDLMNVIKTAIGIALGGVGGALIGHGLTVLGVAGASTGVGAVIGIGIALVATIMGIQVGMNEASIARAKSNLDEYVGQVDEILNRQNSYISVSENAWKSYDETVSKLAYAKYLADQLDVLMGKESLSNEEMQKAQILMDELNNLGLDGINADWDENHEKIVMSKDAIYDNIEAMKEAAKKAAYIEIMTAAWKDQAQALIDQEAAQRHVEKATADLTAKMEELGIKQGDWNEFAAAAQTVMKDEWNEMLIANKELKTAKSRYEDASKAVDEATKAMDGFTGEAKDAAKQTKLTADQVNALKGTFVNVGGTKVDLYSVQQQFQNAGWSAQDAANKAWNLKYALDNLNGMSVHFTVAAYTVANGIATAMGRMTELARQARGYAEGGFIPGFADGGLIPSFANGGINSANLFMAHENAAPELVGRIGNHTAVANTSQMVDAMAAGVYQAMSELMSTSQGQTEVNVYMDGQRIARAVDNANRVRNRRFNVQA